MIKIKKEMIFGIGYLVNLNHNNIELNLYE